MSSPARERLSRLIVIILYRISPDASASVSSLVRAQDALTTDDIVLVWDNSPDPADAPAAIQQIDDSSPATWIYRSTPENLSLAAVYNRAFLQFPAKDLLVIFDQDSSFSSDYFRKADEAFADNPDIDLVVPLVRIHDLIVSPGHYRYIKGSLWQKPKLGRVSSRNTVAIGSGMAIRSSFLRDFGGFDERLRIYGIDSNFMLRYAQKNPAFYVLDTEFGHDLAEFHIHDPATRWNRFEAFRHASLINAQLFPWPVPMLTRLFVGYKWLALRLSVGSAKGKNRNPDIM